MQFDVSGVVGMFAKVAMVVVVAGGVAIGVGLYLRNMPKPRKMAAINLTFALVLIVGGLFVLR
ncbi:hypothetical protein ABB26_08720 [Stenotrophomonas humi]|uniref:Transmembrane protein n=1 Tax=Stenotrophomonas humi TaxID=405444 RepID=A0A0R0CDF5_9GAMM|nr:hypothetical protein [Stenotrophomonas humi]KRG64254.1 hypothetical protein ABB26_08720 [Stenotrophomonas humi]